MLNIKPSPNLTRAIHQVWQDISPDCEGIGNDNECAIEMCIDADRLVFTAGNQAAQDELTALIQAHDYAAVLESLSSSIFLV